MQERYWQLSAAHIRNCLSILNPSHYMIKKKGFHFPMIRFLSFLLNATAAINTHSRAAIYIFLIFHMTI